MYVLTLRSHPRDQRAIIRRCKKSLQPLQAKEVLVHHAPVKTYLDLRAQALAITPAALGLSDTAFGLLMETGYEEAVVTLLALADGTASLYYPLPPPETSQFFVLTSSGVLMATARKEDLGENRHVLSPLFHAAHALITEMRNI